jgi:hypothetical protein
MDWAFGRTWDGDDLGNTVKSNCGPAAFINWMKMMAAKTRADLSFDESDADALYRRMGYDGTPETDNGVVLMDLLDECTRAPVAGVTIDCFFVIGFADPVHLATACQIAPLIVGAELPMSCQNTDMWNGKIAEDTTIWGPHAYLVHSFSPGGCNGKSWGQPVFNTPEFQIKRWRECFLPISQELMVPGTDVLKLLNLAKLL